MYLHLTCYAKKLNFFLHENCNFPKYSPYARTRERAAAGPASELPLAYARTRAYIALHQII